MKPLLKKSALWIKEQAHAVRIVAALFLLVAFFLGFIWMSGFDVEALAFVFSLMASVGFSLPSVAEYFVPERKSIKNMSFGELLDLLDEESPEAWQAIHTDWAAEAFLREDPRLRFRMRYDNAGLHADPFQEPWAVCHPDPHARSYWYDYMYDGNLIDRFIMVDVDGHRATLPLPDANSTVVQRRRYRIAQVFDEQGTLDQYMIRSGLTVHGT